jgi:hypothetical protein
VVIKDFPRRPRSHQLEEQSERYFLAHLPKNWTCEKQVHDYGVDLRVEMFQGDAADGLELLVQLKAAERVHRGRTEIVRLRTSTYNYLKAKLQVVMLVKFVAEEKEAYWVLLRDIAAPARPGRSFTVHIPRRNRLSKIYWGDVSRRIAEVHGVKLGAGNRQ